MDNRMKETRELVMLGVAFLNGTGKAYQDESFDTFDIRYYLPVLKRIGPGMTGVSKVLSEMAMADPDQFESLKADVKSQFAIPQDEIEQKIEIALRVGLEVARGWADWQELG